MAEILWRRAKAADYLNCQSPTTLQLLSTVLISELSIRAILVEIYGMLNNEYDIINPKETFFLNLP